MIDDIVLGRSDSTVTVFVPWDCCNNCSFCTTKKEYKERYNHTPIDELMERVATSIQKVVATNYVRNVVFTGGEPFADLKRLKALIDSIPDGKKCFVNSSLHVAKANEVVDELMKPDYNRIDGISLSSHIAKGGFFDKCIIDEARRLGSVRNVRVNSLVRGDEDVDTLRKFVEIVLGDGGFEYVNFRADYRHIDQNSLNSCNDQFFSTLMSIPEWEYQGHHG